MIDAILKVKIRPERDHVCEGRNVPINYTQNTGRHFSYIKDHVILELW